MIKEENFTLPREKKIELLCKHNLGLLKDIKAYQHLINEMKKDSIPRVKHDNIINELKAMIKSRDRKIENQKRMLLILERK
ncbi:MAG: hypothetical protein ACRBG0_19260 [Lewinella sp.]|uniref:hypothetical protein n=1 Tax=Lewinella sp. TaxID=2004506 RepID=UPI003D6B433A